MPLCSCARQQIFTARWQVHIYKWYFLVRQIKFCHHFPTFWFLQKIDSWNIIYFFFVSHLLCFNFWVCLIHSSMWNLMFQEIFVMWYSYMGFFFFFSSAWVWQGSSGRDSCPSWCNTTCSHPKSISWDVFWRHSWTLVFKALLQLKGTDYTYSATHDFLKAKIYGTYVLSIHFF